MVQSQRISNFGLVVLALVLFMINSAEPKPRSGPKIRRLVEIKTVDQNGVVKERVVAEYEPTEGHKTSSESAGGEKRYQDDDEDSRELSSGDSETYSESYDMVANDDPMSPSNQSSSESSGLLSRSSSSNSTTTKPVDSKSSTVLPTSGRINASTPSPSTARDIISKTTNIDTTTAVPQTTNPATTTGIKATVTTGKSQNATTLSTLSPSTKETRNNLTTLPPKVTEIEATTLATTTMATTSASTTTASAPMVNSSAPTTTTTVTTTTLTPKPTETSTTASPNSTNHGNNNTNQTVIPIIEASVTKGSPGVEAVEGQEDDPEKKASRKTLFGFVTVEILIALLAGALFSVLLVAFLVYRLKKRNEGSYELSETIALRPKEIDEMGKKKEVFV